MLLSWSLQILNDAFVRDGWAVEMVCLLLTVECLPANISTLNWTKKTTSRKTNDGISNAKFFHTILLEKLKCSPKDGEYCFRQTPNGPRSVSERLLRIPSSESDQSGDMP